MGNKQQLYQQLWYRHTLIQTKVTVNVPTITQASILHNSDGYIIDGQQNSKAICNPNNV
jgi:hypothetical protein